MRISDWSSDVCSSDLMGAVAIIALFYTSGLASVPLIAAVAILAAMFALNRLGVRSLPVYLAGFALLWLAVLLSGIHATIAGVLAAFTIPIVKTPGKPDAPLSPLHRLEHALDVPELGRAPSRERVCQSV